MFSGIIDCIGVVQTCEPSPAGRRLVLSAAGYWRDLAVGTSVAIDGVCLTVTELVAECASFDVVLETLRRTTLGVLRRGSRVNLQKSLAVGDRVDGHFVQGHVDAKATLCKIDRDAGESMWWFSLPAESMKYVVPKGSIALDGISLTVAAVDGGAFSVALIPTTLEKTTIGSKHVGDFVNVETDILVRTLVHRMESLSDMTVSAP